MTRMNWCHLVISLNGTSWSCQSLSADQGGSSRNSPGQAKRAIRWNQAPCPPRWQKGLQWCHAWVDLWRLRCWRGWFLERGRKKSPRKLRPIGIVDSVVRLFPGGNRCYGMLILCVRTSTFFFFLSIFIYACYLLSNSTL